MSPALEGPILSLVMIARDEERCIERALSSVVDWVDEMVVVDTGSNDATVQIAQSVGARTAFFAWCEDFAAAKNHALDLARGDMRLVLDADEWLARGGDELRDWARENGARAGLLSCVNYFDAGGDLHQQTDMLTRLLPRGARFEGAIHEQVVHGQAPVQSPLVLHHDGYRDTLLKDKRGRNEVLLRRELERSPRDGYAWFQLGVSLATYHRHSEAIDAFQHASGFLDEHSPQQHALAVRHLYSLGKATRYHEAMQHYREASARWTASPDLHFVMADVLLDLGVSHSGRAEAAIPVIRTLLERCLAIGERPDLPGAVAGRGSWAAQKNLDLLVAAMEGRHPLPDEGGLQPCGQKNHSRGSSSRAIGKARLGGCAVGPLGG